MQVGFFSQKYTLDNYILEKYTLAQKSLVMVVTSLVIVASSLVMVETSLVMMATSFVMVATSLVMVEKSVEKKCDGPTYEPISDMGTC